MPKPPQSKTEWKDQYTLLCESCGYILEGLDHSLPCPECAKPITESLPERRVGTPWQQKPGFKSLLRTWWMTIRHPLKTLDTIRFDTSDDANLPFLSSIWSLIGIPVFLVLTWIESRGLRLFGTRRGFRTTKEISRAIVAHGSVGWLIMGIGLIPSGFILNWAISEHLKYYYFATKGIPQDFDSTFANTLDAIAVIGIVLSLLSGFIFFQTFAYLGLRRCKYANTLPPKEQSDG